MANANVENHACLPQPPDHTSAPSDPWAKVVPSGAFIAGFTPPDYLIDGVLQRRFIYSMTGATGAGKTAVALRLSCHVDQGVSLAGRDVQRGRVLYFAGENPDDVRMRWIGMADHIGFDPGASTVHFRPGVFDIPKLRDSVRGDVQQFGPFALVVVDTSAAYFVGADENDNRQMGMHARMLRSLTTLPGGPTVLVLCHPPKHAGNDSLLPRGGGAFVAEMDGNLTCARDDTVCRLHWQGKFRGPDFEPVSFELLQVKPASLVDSRGRPIPTVVCSVMGQADEADRERQARTDEEVLLRAIRDKPGASYMELCVACGWPTTAKSKVSRVAQRLEGEKLIQKRRSKWHLTSAGKEEIRAAETPI